MLVEEVVPSIGRRILGLGCDAETIGVEAVFVSQAIPEVVVAEGGANHVVDSRIGGGVRANVAILRGIALPFIRSNLAYSSLNNIFFILIFRILVGVIARELRDVLHTHQFAITI